MFLLVLHCFDDMMLSQFQNCTYFCIRVTKMQEGQFGILWQHVRIIKLKTVLKNVVLFDTFGFMVAWRSAMFLKSLMFSYTCALSAGLDFSTFKSIKKALYLWKKGSRKTKPFQKAYKTCVIVMVLSKMRSTVKIHDISLYVWQKLLHGICGGKAGV